MNKILIFLICLFAFNVKAQVKIGTSGAIEPTGDFSAIRSYNVGGGFKYYNDTSDVPDKFKDSTLVVYQPLDSSFYRFDSGSWVELRVNKRIIAGNNIIISGDTISTISSGSVGNADSLGGFPSTVYVRRTELGDTASNIRVLISSLDIPDSTSDLVNNSGFITDPYDGDSSSTDELQNISFNKVGNNITAIISNGTGDTFTIDDGDSDSENERDTVLAGHGIQVVQNDKNYTISVDSSEFVTIPRFIDSLNNIPVPNLRQVLLNKRFGERQVHIADNKGPLVLKFRDSTANLFGEYRKMEYYLAEDGFNVFSWVDTINDNNYYNNMSFGRNGFFISVDDLYNNPAGATTNFHVRPDSIYANRRISYDKNYPSSSYTSNTLVPKKWVQSKLDTLADSINTSVTLQNVIDNGSSATVSDIISLEQESGANSSGLKLFSGIAYLKSRDTITGNSGFFADANRSQPISQIQSINSNQYGSELNVYPEMVQFYQNPGLSYAKGLIWTNSDSQSNIVMGTNTLVPKWYVDGRVIPLSQIDLVGSADGYVLKRVGGELEWAPESGGSSFKSCYKKVTVDFTFSASDTTCNIQNLSNDTIVVTFNSISMPNGSVTNFWNNGDEGLFLFQKGTSNIKVGGVSINTDTVLATASVMYANDTFYVANAVSIEGGSSSNASTLNGQSGVYYLNRSNHTGTQAISTITNLQDSLDNKVNNSTLNNYYTKSEVDSKIDSVVSYHDSITNLRIDSINTAFSYGEYEISANDTITDEWFNRTNWTYSTANTDTITIYLDTGLTVPAYKTVADLFISGTNPIKIQCINSTRINGIVNGSASISTRYSGAGLRKIYNGFEDFALTPAD